MNEAQDPTVWIERAHALVRERFPDANWEHVPSQQPWHGDVMQTETEEGIAQIIHWADQRSSEMSYATLASEDVVIRHHTWTSEDALHTFVAHICDELEPILTCALT